ncbi:general substrate transporter [Sistotremastrum niveocremeum HHB9708]|uniref:General substrate transporter n=2 Tax=Sistotremastraceae TaxID=3402574 RepID=A0A164TP31_9AGAM|nr:general substrate transporter [Sistotremastrum niveocremeum HHB9708]KZT42188.1 general substrate transporter [Sistotremastrum suecicum HHB10207 ss-3]
MPEQQQWNAVVDLVHRGPWWRNHGIFMLNMCLVLPLLTSAINGFDSSVLNGLMIIPDWILYFHHPGGFTLGFMNSAQNIGALIALPIAPFISDGLGRRRALFVGSTVMLAGIAMQSTSTGTPEFIVSRSIIGFGLNIALNAAPLLVTELAYPTQRGQVTSIYNSVWYFGSVLAAWACYAAYARKEGSLWSWRIPSVIQAVPSVIQMICVWFIPESPRWLISRGRIDEAQKILAKYHANGRDPRDPLVAFEVAQIQQALRLETEIAKSTSYLSLFQTPGNRKRMRLIIGIALFSQWSGNGLISYYITFVLQGIGIKDPGTQAQINGSLQIFNFFVATCASLSVERMGRRKLFLLSNVGMLITFSILTLTTALWNTQDNGAAAKASIFLIFCFYLSYDLSYTPLLVSYSLEILPFNIRAKGFAVMNLVVCLSLAFNQFVNPVAMVRIKWHYYIAYCIWLCFELAFVIIFVIETKGRTLEETAALFDGERPTLELQQWGNDAATQTLNEIQAQQLRARLDAHVAAAPKPQKGDASSLHRVDTLSSSAEESVASEA